MSLTRANVSDAAGTASLVVWIFAQTPQLIQNFRRKSVRGLSVVFLVQWMFGDLTNLVGAVLTKQLPFQIAIAVYMLMIDLALVIQYWYYYTPEQIGAGEHEVLTERSPVLVFKYRRPRTQSRSMSRTPMRGTSAGGQRRAHTLERHTTPRRGAGRPFRDRLRHVERLHRSTEDLQVSTESLEQRRGRPRDRIMGRIEAFPPRAGGSVPETPPPPQQRTWLRGRPGVSPGVTRRGTGMVLLGAWFLFGVAPTSRMRPPGPPSAARAMPAQRTAPVVLGSHPVAGNASVTPPSAHVALRHPVLLFPDAWTPVADDASDAATSAVAPGEEAPGGASPLSRPRRKPRRMPLSRKIGRISAWICTVLYITSRLPQIWTNFRRRSVQGLSVFLFIAAFTANLLYTVSVLANPQAVGPDATEYLTDSVPFLLGSGGTLMFDLVIVVQWIMWRGREAPKHAYVSYDAIPQSA